MGNRPIDLGRIVRTLNYRAEGLGTREIARLLERDPRQILRWEGYVRKGKVPVDKLIERGVDIRILGDYTKVKAR